MATDIPNRIAETMEELTKTRNPDKVTVRDVTEVCGISRQTFYYYFRDLDDVMDLVMERGLRRAQKKCAEANTSQEAVELFITDFLDFRDRIKRGLGGPRREMHEEFILKCTRRFVKEWLSRYPGIEKLALNEHEFLLEYASACIVHAIIWYGMENRLDVQEFSAQMDELIACWTGKRRTTEE